LVLAFSIAPRRPVVAWGDRSRLGSADPASPVAPAEPDHDRCDQPFPFRPGASLVSRGGHAGFPESREGTTTRRAPFDHSSAPLREQFVRSSPAHSCLRLPLGTVTAYGLRRHRRASLNGVCHVGSSGSSLRLRRLVPPHAAIGFLWS